MPIFYTIEIIIAILLILYASYLFMHAFRYSRTASLKWRWITLTILCTILGLTLIIAELNFLQTADAVNYIKTSTHALLIAGLSVLFSAKIAQQLHQEIKAQSDKVVKEIKAEKTKLQTVINNLTDGVILIDTQQKVQIANPAAYSIAHKRKNHQHESINKIFRSYNEDTGKLDLSPVKQALATGQVQEISYKYYLKIPNGQVPIAGSVAPIKSGHKITGAIIIFRDNTKDKQIGEAKTEFVSVVSHQLRTPLTGIKWFLQLLLKSNKNNLRPEQVEYVNHTLESTERIINLVNDLLNVSRIENQERFNIKLTKVDLSDVVTKVLEANISTVNSYHVKLANTVKPKTFVYADPDKIYEAVNNLITNAIKYSKGKVKVSAKKQKDYWQLIIKDNGIGIPQSEQRHLFQKFFRAENAKKLKIEGTGLGLYIVKAIIEAHNGQIEYETSSKGTTFYVNLKPDSNGK